MNVREYKKTLRFHALLTDTGAERLKLARA